VVVLRLGHLRPRAPQHMTAQWLQRRVQRYHPFFFHLRHQTHFAELEEALGFLYKVQAHPRHPKVAHGPEPRAGGRPHGHTHRPTQEADQGCGARVAKEAQAMRVPG
jgi:hypothetical protein